MSSKLDKNLNLFLEYLLYQLVFGTLEKNWVITNFYDLCVLNRDRKLLILIILLNTYL